MVRTSQGGSVLSFVLIGGVLAAVLLGAMYFLRQQTAQPSSTPQMPPVSQKEEHKEPATQPQVSPPASENSTSSLPAGGVVELPQTGPAQTAALIIASGVITMAVVGYVRSRRLNLSL